MGRGSAYRAKGGADGDGHPVGPGQWGEERLRFSGGEAVLGWDGRFGAMGQIDGAGAGAWSAGAGELRARGGQWNTRQRM